MGWGNIIDLFAALAVPSVIHTHIYILVHIILAKIKSLSSQNCIDSYLLLVLLGSNLQLKEGLHYLGHDSFIQNLLYSGATRSLDR